MVLLGLIKTSSRHLLDCLLSGLDRPYQDRQDQNEPQKQLSKEFVRQWLIRNGFQGLSGQTLPEMSDDYINSVSQRYIELYEQIMGFPFEKVPIDNIDERMRYNLKDFL